MGNEANNAQTEKLETVRLTATEKRMILETICKTAYYGEIAENVAELKRKMQPKEPKE